MRTRRAAPTLAFLACFAALAPAEPPRAVPVRVERTADGVRLVRGGVPVFVNGAGGTGSPALLAECGGNSVRTWGTDGLGAALDEAHKHGLTVAAGIWLGHERHGFNYTDADQVARQLDEVRRAVERHKDHPALLLWGLGNETEGYAAGDNAAVWLAVNQAAALVKRLDPNHPTMTVTAEVGGDRVKNVHRLCPDIDVVGVNCYGGIATLADRYRAAGGTKPYLVTEYGPSGMWETAKTPWGAAPEPTSTEKAARYAAAYRATRSPGCLGGYAFLWGTKQEATATWFGLLLPTGERLGGADALRELWSGRPPANRCPVVKSLAVAGAEAGPPGRVVRAALDALDPEGDALDVRWELRAEPAAYGEGGDAEEVPPAFPEAVANATARGCEVRLPAGGGGYRLFCTVRDGRGGAATANRPLFVDAPVVAPKAKKAALPLVVFDEPGPAPFAPAGWMGNAKGLRLDPGCADRPAAGTRCLRVEYRAADGWAGVVWQSPANDWGDRPGGFDLTGARRLAFRARGAAGGEVVSFEFGLFGHGKRFPDSASGKLADVRLTADWAEYAIDLAGKDLSRVKSGFCFTVAGRGQPVTFDLDAVRFE